MIIQSVELLSLKVPLHTPFKTAVREVSHIHDLVVRVHCSNGCVGYGSAPSTEKITGDSHASIQMALETILIPLVIGESLQDFKPLIEKLHKVTNAGSNAKAAMDIALFDAYAQYTQQPLYELIESLSGGIQTTRKTDTTIETDYTISVNPVKQMCSDIDVAVARGYRCLKIKIGNQACEDLERLRVIYAHAQNLQSDKVNLRMRLDVNQGWDTQTTINIMQKLEHEGVAFELIEQPLVANDIEGLARIKRAIKTPIMADESAFNLTQVVQLHQLDAVDIINIKLMKAGGLYPAMQIADYCRTHKLRCMMGCMLEGSIGVAAAAHLALAYADVITLIDLDGPSLGQYDPITGASLFKDANIFINTTPGLGISPWQVLCVFGCR
jgi:L-alanine-DL-glutamate epimerase-like enolase superfamily enzyme